MTHAPDPAPLTAEELDSLAIAIHEGDWMMVAEWRWERTTAREREVAFRRATAVAAAYAGGTRDLDSIAATIAAIDWHVKAGSPGRLRAKAAKALDWFNHRDRDRDAQQS